VTLVILAVFLAAGLGGCCRITRTSELDDTKARVAKLEQRLDEVEKNLQLGARLSTMEAQLAQLTAVRTAAPVAAEAAPQAVGAQPSPQAAVIPAVPPSAGARSASTAREHPERYGGVYRMSIAVEPPNIDPAHISDTTSHRVASHIFEGLVEFSEDDLSVQPLLARTWTVSPDGMVFTFELRDDVKFHNGRLCTAEDFVYSFARLLEPKTASERTWLMEEVLGYRPFAALLAARGQLKYVADGQFDRVEAARVEEARAKLACVKLDLLEKAGVSEAPALVKAAEAAAAKLAEIATALGGDKSTLTRVAVPAEMLAPFQDLELSRFISRGLTAPGKFQLRIELGRPFAPFLAVLAMPNAAAIPKEVAEEFGDRFGQHAVGTGPFKLMKWEKQVSLELAAFEDYFGGRPYLDGIRFRILPDDMARLNEFEIGNLDAITEIPDTKYDTIKADPNFPGVIKEVSTLYIASLGFNCTRQPFDNRLVRQAFNHAVRRDIILNVIRHGRGVLAKGILPPGLKAYDPALTGYDYDPKKALELLKQAGYDDPKKLGVIEYWFNATGPNDPNAKLAEVIQQNLLELGVEVKLQSTEWGTYLKKMDRGELSLFKAGWVADYPDPDNFLFVLFHTSMKGGAGNHAYYSNPEVDALLDQGRTTADPAARILLYRKAERQIMTDAPWLPLYHPKQVYMHKQHVKDAKLSAMGPDAMRLRKVWLDTRP
jgi:ABC-type transport system substrate-binding protein